MRAGVGVRRRRLAATLLLGLLASGAVAESSRFELNDGSVIIGDLETVDGGVFVVNSPTLGQVRIEQQRVRSMTPMGAGAATGGQPDLSAQVQQMQQQMVGDPAIMGMITALQDDPELRAAVADPRLMGLIMSGDLDRLQNEPEFQRLMQHPGIRAIIDRVQAR